jgi:hypothetical protein
VIARLRRAHRRAAILLAVLLPILVLLSLARRPAPAETTAWPAALVPDAGGAR